MVCKLNANNATKKDSVDGWKPTPTIIVTGREGTLRRAVSGAGDGERITPKRCARLAVVGSGRTQRNGKPLTATVRLVSWATVAHIPPKISMPNTNANWGAASIVRQPWISTT